MEYLSTAEIAEKWGLSRRRVSVYCKEGRIPGAIQKSTMWLVPADAKKPIDPRKARKMNKSTDTTVE
ncbi:MAG: helix-turn-helix domain-containing protein [Eubacteriales bacterium]|nr:helix-turn-helix domain-containing protein [Eubacteriales bacterium]